LKADSGRALKESDVIGLGTGVVNQREHAAGLRAVDDRTDQIGRSGVQVMIIEVARRCDQKRRSTKVATAQVITPPEARRQRRPRRTLDVDRRLREHPRAGEPGQSDAGCPAAPTVHERAIRGIASQVGPIAHRRVEHLFLERQRFSRRIAIASVTGCGGHPEERVSNAGCAMRTSGEPAVDSAPATRCARTRADEMISAGPRGVKGLSVVSDLSQGEQGERCSRAPAGEVIPPVAFDRRMVDQERDLDCLFNEVGRSRSRAMATSVYTAEPIPMSPRPE
jgi:hypothetical protein